MFNKDTFKKDCQVKAEPTPSKTTENIKKDGVISDNLDNSIVAKKGDNDKPIKKKKVDLSVFNKFKMTKEKREALKNMRYLIDGLFVENYHTFLYGPSGAGKTTIMIHLCFEMIKRDYEVVYLYLDGERNTASKISEEIENRNLSDSFNLLCDGTMNDYKKMLDEYISTKQSLDNIVFILDTFKFFTRNINDKNANKEVMHYIKELCKLGASFISIGHTNKDGKKESGTAEIEQDSDAVLRIDSMENTQNNTATIKKGGRCRFDVKAKSYDYLRGNPLSVKEIDSEIDIEEKNKQKEQLNKDKFFISEIQAILRLNKNIIQKELIPMIKDRIFNIGGDNKIFNLLNRYEDKYWKKTNVAGSNAYTYNIIDVIENEIIELNKKL